MKLLAAVWPGVALPAAMFGVVIVGLLSAGIFVLTGLDNQASVNRVDASTAEQLAHSGLAHSLSLIRNQLGTTTYTALLRGFDDAANTADDGRLTGYGPLGDTIDIPVAGRALAGGLYFAQILDDPNDGDADPLTDRNNRVVLRCTGVTSTGSRAVVETLITNSSASLPAIAFNGPLNISGNPTILGECGDIHANGNLTISGTTTISGRASTSGSRLGSGTLRNTSNQSIATQTSQPTLTIPTMAHSDYCPQNADYILRGSGWLIRTSVGDSVNATSNGYYGWKRSSSSPVVWESTQDNMTTGTFCVWGNAKISHNPGTPSNPLRLSLMATGSVEISGNPYITAEDASNIVVLAGGDLKMNGNPASFTAASYEGIVYGGSNCAISGNPVVWAQLLCKSGALPAGAMNLIDENYISGDARITYNCTNQVGTAVRRVAAWYQRFGL